MQNDHSAFVIDLANKTKVIIVCDLFFRKPIIIVILSFVITYIYNQPLTKLDNKIRERDWSAMATELLCYYISWEETGHEFYILIRLRLD